MTIHGKIEGLESRSEDTTIISGTYYIEKKREKLLKKLKQHFQIRTLLTSVIKIYRMQNSLCLEKVHHLYQHEQIQIGII